jgi:leucyl aminopeptidase
MFDRELDCFVADTPEGAAACLPILGAGPATLETILAGLGDSVAAFVRGSGFTGASGQLVLLPGPGGVAGALLGLGKKPDPFTFAGLPAGLPVGAWRLGAGVDGVADAVLGWAFGAYRFDGLKTSAPASRARLVLPTLAGLEAILAAARATWLVRDLINTPANRLGPAELAASASDALVRRGAHVNVMSGSKLQLLFPALHEVGVGSARPPLVLHASWRSAAATDASPLVSLCGKGVCFDSGGYDIKPPAGMLRMKKDMGGAAIALGLACMIIEADLPVRLEIRLGCVENMISGSAMRPSDVIATRAGLAVEVGNTDAEGRLVLCDLLADACEQRPDMLLDFATLTGAARVALGPDLPALFSNDDRLAELFLRGGAACHDPVWRLPIWDGYNSWLESGAGDLNNVSEKAHAGAVIAALFLQRFVSVGTRWAHFDVYAWNDAGRPGRPAGGEAQTMRAAFEGVASFVGETGFVVGRQG